MSIIRSNSQAAPPTGGALSSISEMNSLRFDGTSYLSRAFGSGDRKTWTWSGWIKRGVLSSSQSLFGVYTDANNRLYINYSSDIISVFGKTSGTTDISVNTGSTVFRDTSAWYHVVCIVDTTQNDRVILYLNGAQLTLTFATTPSPSSDLYLNTNNSHIIGAIDNSLFFGGYLANIHFIDGQALDANAFGEEISGVWVPKAYSGAYGTNGFHLDFAASNMDWTNSKVLDASGNGNNWDIN